MKFSEDVGAGRNTVSGYDRGEIRVESRRYTRSLILAPERIIADWPPQRLDELRPEHLEAVFELAPEIVLIGTGARLTFPGQAVRQWFTERGIGLEVMDTAAACRTYNVIAMEGRPVAALLFMIE